MPVKRKKVTKKKKATTGKKKPTYVCVPCGTEITISRRGLGASTLMCCGRVMKRKIKKR